MTFMGKTSPTARERARAARIRKMFARVIKERGLVLAQLSRKLGRNHAYLHRYVDRGVPFELPLRDRIILAGVLRLSVDKLTVQKASARQLEQFLATLT